MYAVKHEQCKKTKAEVLSKIPTCCICKLIPIPLIRERLRNDRVYCTRCAILENIPQGKINFEDKYLMDQLIIECKNNCGLSFNYNKGDELSGHEDECDYNPNESLNRNACPKCRNQMKNEHDCIIETNNRITNIEKDMNVKFQNMTEKCEERLLNLETNQEILKVQINQISDMLKEIKLKINLNERRTDIVEETVQNQKLTLEKFLGKNSSNDVGSSKVNYESNHIIETNEFTSDQSKNTIQNEIKNSVNPKLFEVEKLIIKLQADITDIQKDSRRQIEDYSKNFEDFKQKMNTIESFIKPQNKDPDGFTKINPNLKIANNESNNDENRFIKIEKKLNEVESMNHIINQIIDSNSQDKEEIKRLKVEVKILETEIETKTKSLLSNINQINKDFTIRIFEVENKTLKLMDTDQG